MPAFVRIIIWRSHHHHYFFFPFYFNPPLLFSVVLLLFLHCLLVLLNNVLLLDYFGFAKQKRCISINTTTPNTLYQRGVRRVVRHLHYRDEHQQRPMDWQQTADCFDDLPIESGKTIAAKPPPPSPTPATRSFHHASCVCTGIGYVGSRACACNNVDCRWSSLHIQRVRGHSEILYGAPSQSRES